MKNTYDIFQDIPKQEESQTAAGGHGRPSLTSGPTTPSLPILSPLATPSIPTLSPHTNPATPSLPVLSPQVSDDGHSNLTTPSLPSLSPAIPPRQLQQLSTPPVPPSPLLSPPPPPPPPKRMEGRRESGEGKLMRPDPLMSR